jgi:hypothetical protein
VGGSCYSRQIVTAEARRGFRRETARNTQPTEPGKGRGRVRSGAGQDEDKDEAEDRKPFRRRTQFIMKNTAFSKSIATEQGALLGRAALFVWV